jgi:hypothetical protein
MSEIAAGTEPASPVSAQPTTEQSAATPARRSVWKHCLAAAVLASGATTLIAAIAHAAGETFELHGAGIPPIAFTQLTLIFSLLGVGLAAILARTARRPRRAFLVTTVTLTALSVVPDLTFGFEPASAAVLILAHLAAAAIVIPVLASRLAATR